MPGIATLGLLLALSAPAGQPHAAPDAQNGTVAGRAEVRLDGRVLHCVGVLLLPQNAAVDAEIRRVFGNNERGRRTVRFQELQQRRRRAASGRGEPAPVQPGARSSDCTVGYSYYGFTFEGVAPGDYYLTTFLDPGGYATGGTDGFQPRGLELMRRVRVTPGAVVRVDFARD
jgi:hypothetical protein